MNVETIDALKKRMAEPCTQCTKDVFKYLMDPQVQGLLDPWIKERAGMIQLHVHSNTLTKHNAGILFLMAIYITDDKQILYYTPGCSTVEGAFEILKEVVAREKKRCGQTTGDTDDVGRGATTKGCQARSASKDEHRRVESGVGTKV